jgi:hypothetical protein
MRVPFLALHRSLGHAITANKIRGVWQRNGAEAWSGLDWSFGEVVVRRSGTRGTRPSDGQLRQILGWDRVSGAFVIPKHTHYPPTSAIAPKLHAVDAPAQGIATLRVRRGLKGAKELCDLAELVDLANQLPLVKRMLPEKGIGKVDEALNIHCRHADCAFGRNNRAEQASAGIEQLTEPIPIAPAGRAGDGGVECSNDSIHRGEFLESERLRHECGDGAGGGNICIWPGPNQLGGILVVAVPQNPKFGLKRKARNGLRLITDFASNPGRL